MKKVLVTGAGGFIGGWLVARLLEQGENVIAVDIKPLNQWFQLHQRAKNLSYDLANLDNCLKVTKNIEYVYNLAADMGGMGFIENNKALCMLSVLVNTHLILASKQNGVKRYFFASSACVYNADKQKDSNVTALKEEDSYPAMPEDGYGWEKLFSERMCNHFYQDFGMEVRVGRYHNVYGPLGTWTGGREKAPAALCRKIAEANILGLNAIEIWGDGNQTRSFMYIDDCIEGTIKLMESDIREPINIGSSRMVSINELVEIILKIANSRVDLIYDIKGPKGVRGRNSDNSKILELLNWEPSISLEVGLQKTYFWIREQIKNAKK
jgi:GDP-D-mannose 3',5'-epimerase